MDLPFTIEQFLGIFEKYNLAVWPMQIVLILIAVLTLILSLKKISYSDKTISIILSFFWLWIGIVYHLAYFTAINKAAYLFGVLFIIQGLIFLFAGGIKSKLSFKFQSSSYGVIGSLFILYALIIYPILGYFFGHVYPKNPTFGLPCPTTIFTFGLLLWTVKIVPKYVLVIPLIWSIIGFGAALSLGEKWGQAIVIKY
ncbi:MAG: hypothetical protein FJ117_23840 [Deltaproteobacteria bacterium]|nr:hypothetical protein [Deltaproteobacteria bacterium]